MRSFSILLLLFLLTACDDAGRSENSASQPPPPQVTVAQPLMAEVMEWDEFTGRFEAIDDVEIRARVSGYLQSVHFKEGAMVNKGDLLFVIDPRPYQAELRQAEADVAAAEAAQKFSEAELERAKNLRAKGNTAERTVDLRSQEYDTAKATLSAARARRDQARLNLDYTRITAPIAGRISNKFVTEGNLVTGGTAESTKLTRIVSLDPIHFVFDIDEQTYLKYTRLAGTGERPSSREHENPVFVTLSDDVDFLREGKMNFVDNNIDRGTGTMRGRAIFQNADLLLTPGMFGRVRIMGSGLYQAMIVPDEAVGSDQGRRIVYVVNDQNEVTVKPVEIGRAIDDMRVIKSGIASGDRIVINGLQRVRPGLVVSPENQMLSPPAHPMIKSMASRGAEPTSAAEETATGANIDATGAEMPQAGSAGAMEETSSP